MDIAHRLGLSALQQATGPLGFAVSLTGLTDNPTYGPCAQRGAPLEAVITGGEGPFSYQWHSTGQGPLAGATGASFVPDVPLAEESEIFCVISAPGQGSQSSTRAVFREVPPQVGAGLFDEVLDLGTGPQIVAAASGFAGENLQFAVSGTGAVIDPVTGDVTLSTDIERTGDVITVSASNSGGAVQATFQVTVEDVAVEGALPFGALTPAGRGGVPVAGTMITQGDPGGHWEITNGLLVPTVAGAGALEGIYPLVFDTGETLDVMIEEDHASARADEIEAVFDALPLTARGLMVQDGDARSLGRIRLSPKIFAQEMVLEPTHWVEDADPRLSIRPVALAGITVGGDLVDGSRIENRMENLTIQGFVCQMETGGGETEGNNGIIRVERPSRHVTIRQNEVWSRLTREIIEADDYRENLATSRQMRGIATRTEANGSAINEHIRIEGNYIHSVSRGAVLTASSAYQGVRSRFCGNIIEHCYTNFFTAGFLNGLDIFDNRCMGVYAANGDTTGNASTRPHSAAGGSFDTAGSRRTQNVSLIGNFFHIGWLRTALCAELGLPKPLIGATGVKFNDPQAGDAYYNLVVAFNTVVSHGICLEITGADADQHNLVFNNTLAYETYAGAGIPPTISFGGAQKVRMFNNLSAGYDINSEDGTSSVDDARTLQTLEGYGNLKLGLGSTGFGEENYFVGDLAKGLAQLTLDEVEAAYVPLTNTRALVAEQKKGALGTGLYQGDGVHSVVWNKAVPSGGTSHSYVPTLWDGQYLKRPSDAALVNAPRTNVLTFAFQGVGDPSLDGVAAQIFALSGQRVYITKSANGTVQMKAEDGNKTFIDAYASGARINSTYGPFNYMFSADFDRGVVLFAINGEVVDWFVLRTLEQDAVSLNIHSPRIFANELSAAGDRWRGQMGLFYLAAEFVDLETQSGIDSFFAADGQFRDFGIDGSAPTGLRPLIYIKNDGGVIRNLGTGGVFVLAG